MSCRQGILRTDWLDPRSNKLYVKLSRRPLSGAQVRCAASHRLLRTGAGGTQAGLHVRRLAGGNDAGDNSGDPPHVRRRAAVGMSLCPAGRWRMR